MQTQSENRTKKKNNAKDWRLRKSVLHSQQFRVNKKLLEKNQLSDTFIHQHRGRCEHVAAKGENP